MSSFLLPDVGEGLDEARVVRWLAAPGDMVVADQPIAEIETAKAVVEIPVPVGGKVLTLGAAEGDTLAVGAVLATIELDDVPTPSAFGAASPIHDVGSDAVSTASSPHAFEQVADFAGATSKPEVATGRGRAALRPAASPVVRQYARTVGIDLTGMIGTGPNARIRREDVQAAAANAAELARNEPHVNGPAPGEERAAADARSGIPFKGVRREIAKSTTQTWQTVPHIFDWRIANASELLRLRLQLRAARPELASLSVFALLARIAMTALHRHPILNATLDEQAASITMHDHINLGIATAGPTGLVVPVLKDAYACDLAQLADALRRLVQAAQDRRLRPQDLAGGTFTINNLGTLGATFGSPLLRVGESGTAAFGKIQDGVIAQDGQPVVVPTIGVTLCGDHRVLDGADLCSFANTVVELIEHPNLLLAGM
ncbi:MAG: hypothetical protein DLM61_03660 [Pseudonocardiales bacterium]|nr:MAG: hypothetical protein DLM61_03660 [Pseudonocardiales bacterium]